MGRGIFGKILLLMSFLFVLSGFNECYAQQPRGYLQRKMPASSGEVNLLVQGYRIPKSQTLEIKIAVSPKLNKEDESKAQVIITLPDGQRKSYSLADRGITKEFVGNNYLYTITLSNLTSGGRFKVEIDPRNLINEWDESDNVKVFDISQEDLERRWEAGVDLIGDIYLKALASHTVVFEVRNHGRKLTAEEETRCKINILYPGKQITTNLSQFVKSSLGQNQHVYTLEIPNIHEGGMFKIEIDVDNAIFETREDNNSKTVTINKKELSRLLIKNCPGEAISLSKVNVEWTYSPPPGTQISDFYYEISDQSGNRISGPTPIYNLPRTTEGTYSYQLQIPANIRKYRIKIFAYDYLNSYDIYDICTVNVKAATPPANPVGFAIESLPSRIQRGSTLNLSWTADPNIFSRVTNIQILAPDLKTIIAEYRGFLIQSSSGNYSLPINFHDNWFENNRLDIFIKFLLERKQTDITVPYFSNMLTVLK